MPFDGMLTEISSPTKADITRLRHRAAEKSWLACWEDCPMPLDGVVAEIDEITRVRRSAAALLEKKGWCQKTSFMSDGRMCIAQALHEASGHNCLWRWPDVDRPARSMGFDNADAIVRWNDCIDRTREEVIARLLGGSNAA